MKRLLKIRFEVFEVEDSETLFADGKTIWWSEHIDAREYDAQNLVDAAKAAAEEVLHSAWRVEVNREGGRGKSATFHR